MAFPVAYRKESQEYSNWQPKGERDIQTRPKPANDNLPQPANDNIMDIVSDEMRERIGKRTLGQVVRYIAPRLLRKLNPYLNAIDTGVQIGEIINDIYRPVVSPPEGGGGEPTLDLSSWEWMGKPFNYPADRAYFVRFQATDFFGVQYEDNIDDLPGHAATPADNAIDFLGSVYWTGGAAQYQLVSPDIYTDAPTDPWVDGGGEPTIRWIMEPGRIVTRTPYERDMSETGGDEIPLADPWIGPRQRLNDWSIATGIGVNPDGSIKPSPAIAPWVHNNRPPGPGEKEKKFISNARGTIMAVFGGVTEVGDIVDSLWEALPKSKRYGYYLLHKKGGGTFWKRRHGATLGRKIVDVYRGLDSIDMNAAIWNLATNEIQDHLIGKLGKASQKAQKPWLDQLGRPVGLGTGPAL